MSKIKLLNTMENGYFQNNQLDIADSIPITGTYKVGDIIIKSTQVEGEAIGWICIEEGYPGIWSEFGASSTNDNEFVIDPGSIGMTELDTEVKSKLALLTTNNSYIKQLQQQINSIENEIENGVGDVSSETIGELSQLKTDDKSNVVNSINEVYDAVIEHESAISVVDGKVIEHESAISELRDMITGQKESLINNINELIDEI